MTGGRTSPEQASVARTTPGANTDDQAASLHERVAHVINLIRPAVQADGGDVELVGIGPDGTVRIRLHGACVGCPSSTITLQMGIERNLKEHIQEVKRVEAID